MAANTMLTGRLPKVLGTVVVAGVGIGAYTRYMGGVAYADNGAPLKAFGGGPAFLSLQLQSSESVNHNTKRLRFALPTDEHVSGLPLTCKNTTATTPSSSNMGHTQLIDRIAALLTFSWPKGSMLPCVRPYTPISKSGK